MSRYVIDASAAAEYLLRTSLGLKVANIIEDGFLLAPKLLDVEVLSVLRCAVLRWQLDEQRALRAVEDLMSWPIDRISHTSLLWAAWQHRNNVSAYDCDAPLSTTDGPLSRASSLGIVVENVYRPRLDP